MADVVNEDANIEMVDQNSLLLPADISEIFSEENIDVVSSSLTPHVGQEFSSDDIAYDFYNKFSLQRGFGVRKYSKDLNRAHFVCNKEGYKKMNDKRQIGKQIKRRRDYREGCKAHMNVSHVSDGVWVVRSFSDVHTHPLISTPKKRLQIRSHLTTHREPSFRALIGELHDCGIGPAKIARVVNKTSGRSYLNITPQQCSDHLKVQRKNNIGRECRVAAQKFIKRSISDKDFFYMIEIDEHDNCRSMFWADGRARASYMQFCDVIVFDVTYRTNKFCMPFAPFTGVNHHRQSTLFGCALLADETEETFVWLFEQWLSCMDNKAPRAIITDQDPAIRNAIKRVFPDTHHRFCSWHLSLHEEDHIKSLRCAYPEFINDYKLWKKCRTIEESERSWDVLKDKYKMVFDEPLSDKEKNQVKSWRWLENMYDQRHQWVKAYLKDTFWAGMKSSQRSESMNAFFDGFVHSSTPISEFIDQYDKAILDRREKEEKEDFLAMTTKPDLKCMHPFEAHAGIVYTKNVFRIFQEEFKYVLNCRHNLLKKYGAITIYVVQCKYIDRSVTHNVEWDASDDAFNCTCAKFQMVGILCKHIMHVMTQPLDYSSVPQKYILSRWTLNSRYSSAYDPNSLEVGNEGNLPGSTLTSLEKWRLSSFLKSMDERVGYSRDLFNILKKHMENAQNDMDKLIEEQGMQTFTTQACHDDTMNMEYQEYVCSPNIIIRDPTQIRTKGRPRHASRIPSGISFNGSQTKKGSRACKTCHCTGHNSRTCPNKVVESGQETC